MIFHENCLLADDSHEIHTLFFSKSKKDVAKCVVCRVLIGPLRVKHISGIKDHRKELDRLRLSGDFIQNQKILEENKERQWIVARCQKRKQ